MKFFTELTRDSADGQPPNVAFTLDAPDLQSALRIVNAYAKGAFEASGNGLTIDRIGTKPLRKIEYREL